MKHWILVWTLHFLNSIFERSNLQLIFEILKSSNFWLCEQLQQDPEYLAQQEEAERIERERLEAERLEQERLERERLERERLERERIEKG